MKRVDKHGRIVYLEEGRQKEVTEDGWTGMLGQSEVNGRWISPLGVSGLRSLPPGSSGWRPLPSGASGWRSKFGAADWFIYQNRNRGTE